MDFKMRELRFGLKDEGQFSEPDVVKALRAQGFADVEIKSGPS